MTSSELLIDAFGRIRQVVHRAVAGLTPEQLAFRIDPEANSIAWLVWHLTRIQDDHLADAAHAEQVWTSQGWVERFGLPFDPLATGYGHRAGDVAAVHVESGKLLTTTTRSTSRRPTTLGVSATPILTASWTGHGIRQCRWACGW
jgi:hypothetical protein